MGINIHVLRLLLHARAQGANLDRTITIGRLDALLTPEQLKQEFNAFGEQLEIAEAEDLLHKRDRFCEPIIERLGASTVDSLDASDYEDATVVHDLNSPIADEMKGKYSLVIDGGTLEHVFHFPEALKSCMSLAEVGGHVMLSLPANNEMGHGFYQFSPDLFYRAFSEENGYRVKGLYLVSLYADGDWLEVGDPKDLRSRVGYNNPREEMGLLVLAQRIADVPLFTKPPQQSDYVAAWCEADAGNRLAFFDQPARRPSRLRAFIPESVLRLRRLINAGRYVTAGPDPALFRPFDPRPISRQSR